MKTEIQLFSNPEFGEVRTSVTESNEPVFCLVDLCEILELNPSKVSQRLNDDVLSKHPILDSLNREQQANFVNEDGLYDVILDSRKPEARKFRKWITSEVLPSIRKSGGYIVSTENDTPEMIMARALQVAQQTIDNHKQRVQALESETKEQEKLIEKQRPAVVFMNAVTSTKSDILMRDMAKLLSQNGVKIGEIRLYDWMTQHKYLIRNKRWSNSKQTYVNIYMPSQRASDLNIFFVSSQIITTGEHSFVKHTIKVTPKGQTYFINKFLKEKTA